IYRANACIEGCTKSTQLVESLKKRLIAEAKFFRAYSYFYLLNIYADVPLITGTDFKVNESKPRVPITEVYNQIIKDLSEAEADLQLSNESSERVRVDKAVVQAFLARVYLYTKNWSDAEIAANNIIDNPNYVLETDLDQAFASSGREAIFRLMPANPGFETPEGFLFVPSNSSTIPKYYISESLLSSFSAEDKRREHWLNKNTVNGTDYYYPYKYKTRRQSQPSSDFTERYNVLRLAETYLIRAEARAQQDKVDDGLEDLNRIRGRAGLQDTTLSGKDELLAAIFNERRLELFAEGAHRWLDMKRTDRIDAIMPAVAVIKGTTWSPEDKLWPIPFYQIQSNPALTQNPGYQ
ncbi:MAG: RagB/SusD family nutrient uptake outer membrane protein, partial [Chitinophagaceae bacterium]|nr:RagB/SusD family nutrient uptake outer membrane protein [Chitinophagaceae bacterium]